jgi:putative hydrolase of the HAD superfamily
MTINTILFDVGGVIVAPLEPEEVWERREQLAQDLGYESGEEMWVDFYTSEEWEAAKTGRMLHSEMWERLLRPHGFVESVEQARFVAALHEGEGLHPTMRKLITHLHGDYRLGILSNWDNRLEEILEEKLGVAGYFDSILNSYRIGVAKPEERAFQIALESLEAQPEETFFIDDLERNTEAAEALGIASHTYTDLPTLIADLRERNILNGEFVLDGSEHALQDKSAEPDGSRGR